MSISNEIKERLDIAGVLSEYIVLEKSGRNLKALCPFHTEKTASFFVFPERQSWRCFGCGSGGDLISFVMKKEGIEFGEAIKMLAPRAGIALEERYSQISREPDYSRLYEINKAAALYYHDLLIFSPRADGARKYIERRKLVEQTVQDFQLGFSLDEWDGLKKHLTEQGYQELEQAAAGVVVEKNGRIYDRFRGRLMFPITDAKNRVLGFGARALDDSMPKYLNSAESPVFNKSSIVYGLGLARDAIKEQGEVVIVEGYMDTLTAHQNGFCNVVASMGTSLTEKQITAIKGITTHICLSLDADAAGNAATMRGIEVCRKELAQGVRGVPGWLGGASELKAEIDIIKIPKSKDPDQVIRENPQEWQKLIDGAQPVMDFVLEAIISKIDLTKQNGKLQACEQLLPMISEIENGVEREIYLGKLSRLVGINEKTLAGMIASQYQKSSSKKKKVSSESLPSKVNMGDQAEEYCLSLLLKYPLLKDAGERLNADYFERSENKEVFIEWGKNHLTNEALDDIDFSLRKYIETLKERPLPPLDVNGQKKALADCIRRLEIRIIKTQYIFDAESAIDIGTDTEETSARLMEIQRQQTTLGW